jgi:hypothetical protein
MNVKIGDKILFQDDYMNYQGYSMGKEYYKGIVKKVLNSHVVSVIFSEMSFDKVKWFNVGKVYTTTDIKDILTVI